MGMYEFPLLIIHRRLLHSFLLMQRTSPLVFPLSHWRSPSYDAYVINAHGQRLWRGGRRRQEFDALGIPSSQWTWVVGSHPLLASRWTKGPPMPAPLSTYRHVYIEDVAHDLPQVFEELDPVLFKRLDDQHRSLAPEGQPPTWREWATDTSPTYKSAVVRRQPQKGLPLRFIHVPQSNVLILEDLQRLAFEAGGICKSPQPPKPNSLEVGESAIIDAADLVLGGICKSPNPNAEVHSSFCLGELEFTNGPRVETMLRTLKLFGPATLDKGVHFSSIQRIAWMVTSLILSMDRMNRVWLQCTPEGQAEPLVADESWTRYESAWMDNSASSPSSWPWSASSTPVRFRRICYLAFVPPPRIDDETYSTPHWAYLRDTIVTHVVPATAHTLSADEDLERLLTFGEIQSTSSSIIESEETEKFLSWGFDDGIASESSPVLAYLKDRILQWGPSPGWCDCRMQMNNENDDLYSTISIFVIDKTELASNDISLWTYGRTREALTSFLRGLLSEWNSTHPDGVVVDWFGFDHGSSSSFFGWMPTSSLSSYETWAMPLWMEGHVVSHTLWDRMFPSETSAPMSTIPGPLSTTPEQEMIFHQEKAAWWKRHQWIERSGGICKSPHTPNPRHEDVLLGSEVGTPSMRPHKRGGIASKRQAVEFPHS